MLERIGNCRILSEIGSGGMAVIYKAVQESLNRTVAIKALKTHVGQDPQFAIRFEREALSVASLQHENIIHIYDFYKFAGALYIVMEFVEGIDLYDLLEKCGKLPIDVAAIIALQVARALDYAHYRGIIHRDVKPANIMLSKQGGVKLMDFGIARDPTFGDLTETGTGLGTPSYMSPEQILGDKLDFRSDIFSLGIVLYQMCTGTKPFVEDEHKSVMHKIRLEKYTSPRKLNPLIPRELERIMARCMQKMPRDRYRSTQELVRALERYVDARVTINYNARVVLFLRSNGIVSEEEAAAFLHPSLVGPGKLTERGAKESLARVAVVLGGLAAASAIWTGVVHMGSLGQTVPTARAARAARSRPGFLRVVARPWADVFVDGRKVGTTPFDQALPVGAGRHRVVLTNPYFVSERRDVEVPADSTITLGVDLKKRKERRGAVGP